MTRSWHHCRVDFKSLVKNKKNVPDSHTVKLKQDPYQKKKQQKKKQRRLCFKYFFAETFWKFIWNKEIVDLNKHKV